MTLRSLLRNLMLAALVAGSVTCSGDKLSLPDQQRPSRITIMRGDNQAATVGQPVADSLIVRVTDSKDRPVVDQPVRFTAGTNGSGAVLIPDSVVTDADGQARARWVLGTTAGTQTAVAQAVGFSLSATFNATAAAAPADTIFLVRGNNQAANVNAPLADSLVVRVTDPYRNPVSGIAVSWSASGGGSVSATSVLTGSDGQAAVERILGPQAGIQGAEASATGLKGSPVGFSHTALAGGPAALVLVTGDNQTAPAGLALAESLMVKLVDGAGNGVANRAVAFAPVPGNGTASPTPVTTDAGGLARSSWTLGPNAGPQSLIASSSGFSVSFSATATADVPTRLLLSAGNNQTDTVGSAVTTAPAVRVLDANNNPVAGVGVTFTVTGGGGTVTGPSGSGVSTVVATGANGVATLTSWVLGTTAGGNSMAASASGASGPLQGSPVNFSATGAAGAESRLGVVTQPPSSVASDAILSPAPVVRLEDAFGNPVGKSGVAVSVLLSGGGTLRGTATRNTNAQGQATFSGLSIQGLVGAYTLNFSAAGLTGVSSATINLTPGAAAALGITTQPSTSAQSGVVFPIQPVIQVQDSAGNPVSQAGVNVMASIATGGGTLNGTVTLASNAQGSVGYTNLAISGTSGPRTLLFSAAGLTAATSNPVTIGAGGGSKLAFIQQPTNGTAGAALAPAVTVAVQDANGNTVTGSNASITLALGANPGGATLGGTLTVSAVNGIATFSTLTLNRTGQGYTLAASSSGLTGATSSGFDISPAAAAGLVFSVQPTSAVAGAVIVPPIQVTVQDAFGNTVTTATTAVTLAIGTNPAGGALSGTRTVNAVAGIATFNDLSIDKAGNGYTLTADDGAGGLPLVSSAGFNISVGTGNRLAFVVQPGNTTAGAAISPAVQVAVQDGSGNTVTGATDAITLAIGNNAGGGTLSGTLTVNAVNGIATFGNLSINRSGTGYTLNATAGGLASATSGAFNVTPGAATQLVFTQQPTNTVAATVMNPAVTVAVQDANGNVVTGYGTAVSLAFGTNAGGGTLTGGGAVTPVNGVATFGGLSVNRTGSGYTLVASSASLQATSTPFDITPGQASVLAFSVQPASAVAGVPIAPSVQLSVRDASGNTVTSSTASITVALGANPGGGTLSGTLTVAAVNGIATFGNLSVDRTGTGYTLTAASSGLMGVTSSAFNVTPAAASQLVFARQPTNTVAGQSITPAVQVAVQDQFGNVVTTATTSITVAIGTNPGSGSLSGITTVSAVGGVASFGNLSINAAANGYTLTANGGGLPQATSTAFDITVGTGNKLVFFTQPSTVAAGAVITPAVQVEVQDAAGNRVTGATNSISVAINNNPSGGALTGTTTVNAVAGLATFSSLKIDKAGNGYTLFAFASGLNTGTSAAFNVTQAATTTSITSESKDPTVVGEGYAVFFSVAVTPPASGVPTGLVTVSDGVNVCTGSVAVGSCSLVSTAAGAKTLTATYQGDANFAGSTSAGAGHTVNKANTTTIVTSDPTDPSLAGQSITVNFLTTVNSPGVGTPTGNVTITDGVDACSAPVTATSCTLAISRAGSRNLTATYPGDANFNGSSDTEFHTTNKAATTTTAVSDTPDPSTVGGIYTVTWALAVTAPGGGSPSGNVTVSDGQGGSCSAAAVSTLGCSLATSTVGTKTLTISYPGDANYTGSSTTTAHDVGQAATATSITAHTPDPSVTGQGVSVSVSVTSAGGTPTGSVTVSDGAVSCNVTLSGGAGSCSLAPVSAGTRTLTATYGGDANFSGSVSSGVSHTVNPAATATSITSDTPDPSTVGTAYTVSFTVTASAPGTGTPTGTVTVSDGAGGSCATTVAVAGCSITPATAGTRTLTATYGGDLNYSGSVSSGVSHVVSAAPTTTSITADTPDPSLTGEQVAVSVSVIGAGGTPSGSVTVSDGSDQCVATLSGGTGSCNVILTHAGNRTLSANYGGDANYAASSGSTGHLVNLAATTTTITSDTPDPSTVNSAYTVTYAVAVTAPGTGAPTGNVTVTDGVDSCVGTAAAGSCSLTSTTLGARTLTATYAGDLNYSGSVSAGVAHQVNPFTTTTSITGHTPDPSVVGQGVTVNFSVTSAGGTPTGSVTVSDGSATCNGSLTSGAGSCLLTPTSTGTKTLTATYGGAGNFASSVSAGVSHQVNAFGSVDPALSTVAVSPGTITASSGTSQSTITVTVKDQFNNPVSGATVVLAATGSGNTLTQPVGTTNSSGVATGTLSSTSATPKTVSATANSVGITQTQVVTVTAGTATGATSTATVPATGTAGTATNIAVQAKDQFGNTVTVGGAAVVVTVTGSNSATPVVTDNGNGTYATSYTPTAAGPDNIAITLNGVAVVGSPFTSTVSGTGSVSPSLSTVAVSPGTITASSGTSQSTITVTVKDQFNNPISGATVVLSATGTGNTLTQPVGTTNASGVATGTLSSTSATPKTVSATANSVGITQTQVVTVTAGTATGATSTATVPATGTAGTATNIAVQAKDQFGNTVTVGGATVVVTVTGANSATPAVTDNGNGTYSTSYIPTAAGPDNVAITLNGVAVVGSPFTSTVSGTGSVSPSLSTVAVSPGTITASSGTSQSTITVTVKDQFGNPISGATVVLSATGTGNTLTQPVGTTNSSGVATGTLSSTSATPKTVSATANSVAITQTQVVTVTAGTATGATSTATVPATGTAGTATNIAVQAKDQFGNTVTVGGATVVVTVTGANSATPAVTDNGNGTYSTSYIPTAAGPDNVAITLNGVAVVGSPFTSTVSGTGSVSPSLSTVAVSPGTITASSGTSQSTITVTVKDQFGNPISGATVVLSATGTGNTLTQPVGTTNSSGVATGTLSSTAATPKTVSATANSVGITQTQVVTVTAGTATGATSTATVPATGTAGTATNIAVQAKDQFGNTVTVGGAAVVVTVTGANSATPTVTDNGNGTYSTSYIPTAAGPDNVAITLNGVAVVGSPFTSTVASSGTVSPSLSTVAVSPGTITASSGTSQSTITVTVKDQFGNPISGATVVLSATGTGNTLTQPVGTTNSSGVATGTLSSTAATPKTVSATANSVAITQTQGVTVNPDVVDPTQSTAVVPAGTATVQTTITIQAKDQFGNNLTTGGATVVVTITGTNPGSAVVVDNLNGTYTATYTPASAGSDTIDITINSTAIQGSPFTSVVN